jgi:hypothetical protein
MGFGQNLRGDTLIGLITQGDALHCFVVSTTAAVPECWGPDELRCLDP